MARSEDSSRVGTPPHASIDDADRPLAPRAVRALLEATQSMTGHLDLAVVLRRIIQSAVDLVGARYGALGVIGSDGLLEQFIHVGIPEHSLEHMGPLPRGSGLLGALIEDPRPLRLADLREDPRWVPPPAGHPSMKSFLGVPIRVRGEVYGNLYLADHRTGVFSAQDQQLVLSLAATAGVAIDNARRFEETALRQRWATAAASVTAALLDEDVDDPLAVIGDSVVREADAEMVVMVVRTAAGTFAIDRAWGLNSGSVVGQVVRDPDSVSARVARTGEAVIVNSVAGLAHRGQTQVRGPGLGVPLTRPDGLTGVLVAVRAVDAPRFHELDREMLTEFAGYAGVALALREARRDRERLALLEDRNRIARDLHDNVIQRLFAAGLIASGLEMASTPDIERRRLRQMESLLDAAIGEIRRSVFHLTTTAPPTVGLRHRLLDVIVESASLMSAPPRVTLSGALDSLAVATIGDDLEAVVREGLANVIRHADANATCVCVTADDQRLTVTIMDDGRGGGNTGGAGTGLRNLAERAAAWGGACELRPGPDGGSVLEWSVPAPAAGRAS